MMFMLLYIHIINIYRLPSEQQDSSVHCDAIQRQEWQH